MEARKPKLRVRKPLLDCTNTISSQSSTSTPCSISKAKKSNHCSKIKYLLNDNASTNSGCSSGSTAHELEISNPSSSSLLPPVASPHLPPPNSLSISGADGSETPSIYSRRNCAAKRKHTGKEIVVPLSCPPKLKTEGDGNTTKNLGNRLSKTSTVSHKKKPRTTTNDLPQHFIEKQRAYFAKIDAFELLEEEVESDEDM